MWECFVICALADADYIDERPSQQTLWLAHCSCVFAKKLLLDRASNWTDTHAVCLKASSAITIIILL